MINAEVGQVSLENLIAILMTLDLLAHLDLFLPEQPFSSIQLLKLRGKIRQGASRKIDQNPRKDSDLGW